jgi:(p)ppGpp synthase/HD superfamily hydrolase
VKRPGAPNPVAGPSGEARLAGVFDLLERRGEGGAEQRTHLLAAYAIAERAHARQQRKSGDPYISHPVAVAEIAATLPYSSLLVTAALLHDVPDAGVSLAALAGRIDTDALAVVQAQNVLERTQSREAVRHSIRERAGGLSADEVLSMAIALKIADRLHNARTWEHVPTLKARRKAIDTLDVIAPAAAAAGLTEIRDELLTLSHATLRHRQPSTRIDRHPGGTLADRGEHSLLHRAIDRLPPLLRERCAEEWPADLAALTGRRDRWIFVLGLQYSARAMSKNHDRRR